MISMRFLKRINWSTVAGIVVIIGKLISDGTVIPQVSKSNIAALAIGGGLIRAKDKSEDVQ